MKTALLLVLAMLAGCVGVVFPEEADGGAGGEAAAVAPAKVTEEHCKGAGWKCGGRLR